MDRIFEYVCSKCGRMAQHNLELFRPGAKFKCPYCKSVFGLVNNRIQLVLEGRRIMHTMHRNGD